jgi:hypothetical protein
MVIGMLERDSELAPPISHLVARAFEQHGHLCIRPVAEKFVVFRPPLFDETDVFEMSPGSNGSSGAAKFFSERAIRFGSQQPIFINRPVTVLRRCRAVIEAVHGRVVLPALFYIKFGSRALARNGYARQNGAMALPGGSKNDCQLGRTKS